MPKEDVFLPRLRRVLAFRGDASFMAVVEPGRLTIYDVALEREAKLPPARSVTPHDRGAASVIPELALSPDLPERRDQKFVSALLLELLDRTDGELARHGVTPEDALSLTGRALFLRFLIDRHIIGEEDRREVCPSAVRLVDAFASPGSAFEANAWLDRTFNGDLLPLPSREQRRWLKGLDQGVFVELTKVVQKTDPWGQLSFNWGGIDFGHVPVGLLSQVYERHSHRFDREVAQTSSIHYTPRHIAEYLVEEAFFGIKSPETARVLDPACGAGVFLVAAFRHIVAAKWRKEKRPPRTAEIRKILDTQLRGIDVNEAALRLSALSLYLTALELDPDPRPPAKLRFSNLRGSVLHDARLPEEQPDSYSNRVAGALGPAIGKEHKHKYDIVIGNPPWTAWGGEDSPSDVQLFNQCVARVKPVVQERLGEDAARDFGIPDLNPDLLFVWRAMEWAKPGGRIAMALHARLLFKTSEQGKRAREDLFKAMRVTGVFNGAALQQTKVWPDVAVPFCLVLAENRKPNGDSSFFYISPDLDPSLNKRGQLRIDPSSADPVALQTLLDHPYILKTLYRGTALDVDVIERISEGGDRVPLSQYWQELGLTYGKGYQVGGRAGTQQDAASVRGLPDLTKDRASGLVVDVERLPALQFPTLLRTRSRDLYRAPLVLAPQSPGAQATERWARIAFSDVAFTESFIGYSCHGHPHAQELARYLFVVLNSQLHLYYSLMTSGQFGIERRAFYKEDYDAFPIPRFEGLSAELKREVVRLADALVEEGAERLPDVRRFVCSLYGLRSSDVQTISDALDVALPFKEAEKTRSLCPPTVIEQERFAKTIASLLDPLLEPFGVAARVKIHAHSKGEPWIFAEVRTHEYDPVREAVGVNIGAYTRDADVLGCSQLIVRGSSPPRLLVGTLAQYRYWTPTHARLTAMTILRDHQDLFVPEDEQGAQA
jgi:hypothetical protein